MQVMWSWPLSQTAKTSPSHGEDMGSIPVWVTNLQIPMVCSILAGFRSQRVCETLAYTPCAASFRSGRISSFLLRSILTKNSTVVPWDFFVLIRDSSEYVIWYHYKGIGKGNLHKNALSFYKILRFFRSLSVLVSLHNGMNKKSRRIFCTNSAQYFSQKIGKTYCKSGENGV